MRFLLALVCCSLFAVGVSAAATLHDGDIIFQTSRSAQSAAIQRATHSPYSHVGVVLFRDGEPFVFEASATVRYTPLADWIARGDGGRHVVKRLTLELTPAQSAKLHAVAQTFLGKPYDLYFEWSDERIVPSWCGRCTSRPWACGSARCRSCANSISLIRWCRRKCVSVMGATCHWMSR